MPPESKLASRRHFAALVLVGSATVSATFDAGAQINTQSASSCNWPMHASLQLKDAGEYPTTVLFHFSKAPNATDLITITETTVVSLAKLVRDFPVMVQSSAGWRDMQSRLNCQNRAGDFSYSLTAGAGNMIATFGATVEKFWCASADVPCPTIEQPLRFCRKDSNGKVWGANVSSSSTIALQQDGSRGFKAVVISTSSSSNTSNEQNFMRDLMGGALLGPIGVSVVRDIESNALRAIRDAMRNGFDGATLRLSNGAELPELPNYEPILVGAEFRASPLSIVVATIERKVPEYRESSGCFLAKQMGAQSIPAGPREGRRGGRG